MKELKIYEYQAKNIEDALRIVSNRLNCKTRETALDRSVTQALQMIRNVINENPDAQVFR